MERMTFDEMRKDYPFLEFMFIKAATLKKGAIDELIEAKNEDGTYEISLMVNGVELPLIEAFRDLEKQRDRMIREVAAELIKEKFANLDDVLYEAERTLREELGVSSE